MTEARRIAEILIRQLICIRDSPATPVPADLDYAEWQEILRVMLQGFEAAAVLANPETVIEENRDDLEREMHQGFEYFRRYFHWL